MNRIIRQLLSKLFDIREGEFRRVLLMQANIFLIITTLLIIKPTVNGLFLSEIGVENLPFAFVLVAVFAILVSVMYTRLIGRAGFNRIILGTLTSSVGLFILFGILLRFHLPGAFIYYALYICVAIFAVLTASQFWILANVVFNAREAKRLFGFIGAGAIAGGIFGGYLTTILAEAVGSENLLFVGAGFLSFCIPITSSIWKRNVMKSQSRFQRRKKITRVENPLKLIRKSPHLVFLAGIIGISVIVAKLVDYQFNAIASYKIQDPDELTAFFGFWFSNFNVISLIFQLLLTRRIVGMLGIGTSLFFLPGAILIGAVCVFFFPELWAVIFIKMSDGSIKQSINKASVELLALPIPANIKNQTKTFIDVVVDSIATGMGGVILIFLVNGLELSTRFISLMTFVLIGIWIYFVIRIRKTYLDSFKTILKKTTAIASDLPELKNESVVGDLKELLNLGSEDQILLVLGKLKEKPDSRFSSELVALLKHSSDKVKEEAIRNLYFLKDRNLAGFILPFTIHPSQRVKIAAFDYLLAHTPLHVMELMEKFLNDPDHKVQLAGLVSLAEESRDNPPLKEKFKLKQRLESVYDDLSGIEDAELSVFYKIGWLKAAGLSRIPVFFSRVEAYFTDPDPKVAGQALLSGGDTLHPYFIPQLMQYLGHQELGEKAISALVLYGYEIVPVIEKCTQSPDPNSDIIRFLPSVLEKVGTQSAADLLFRLLKNGNADVRLASLRSLYQLRIRNHHLHFYKKEVVKYILEEARVYQDTLSVLYVQLNAMEHRPPEMKKAGLREARQELIRLLESRLDTNLERIFRLLGLRYPPEDIGSIYENLYSRQPDLRSNALEYLDNLLDSGLKKVLMPIVETALLDSLSEKVVRELNLKIPDENECFQLLLSGGDADIRAAVLHLQKRIE